MRTTKEIFMDIHKTMSFNFIVLTAILVFSLLVLSGISQGAGEAILSRLPTISQGTTTVPSNGDVNPYGVARVPRTIGKLKAGHILISNFNNSSNLQGTGTTIVDVSPDDQSVRLFAKLDAGTLPGPCHGGVGLTTALAVLRHGWVIVGSLPTSDGTSATAQAGCLIALDSMGNPVETISGPMINGPWDMTVREGSGEAMLFISNVLNGTVAGGGQIVNQGTIVRINLKTTEESMPQVESMTIIGSGFAERTDPAALVIGPTGLGLSSKGVGKQPDVLYVADSLNNQIVRINDPLNRKTSDSTGKT